MSEPTRDAPLSDDGSNMSGSERETIHNPSLPTETDGRASRPRLSGLVGVKSGIGKSNTAYYLASQPLKMGASALLIDPKGEME